VNSVQKDYDWIELIQHFEAVRSRQTRSSQETVNDEIETGFQLMKVNHHL
jgi:hypothetical protein